MGPTDYREKIVLTEMLQLYKGFPCLWDQKHMLYGCKEARDEANAALLDKYKLIQPDANVFDVKKKIEYLRCAYRREHKRVLLAHHRGGTHKPTLWYYDLLRFLNDHHVDLPVKSEDSQETHEIDDSDEDRWPLKRRKEDNMSTNAIFMPEQHNNIEEQEDQSESYQDDQSQPYIVGNEPEAFGRTIGFQLKELNHMQRVFAEKLISDVIFQARLCNLSPKTSLNLDD